MARKRYSVEQIVAKLREAEKLEAQGLTVAQRCKRLGISVKGRTTIRVPGVRVADDLVERQFRPAAPNVLWGADITYRRTWEG